MTYVVARWLQLTLSHYIYELPNILQSLLPLDNQKATSSMPDSSNSHGIDH